MMMTSSDDIRKCREFLVDRMDPDFGLLNKMLSSGIIGWSEMEEVKSKRTSCKRNSKLLDYILAKDQGVGLTAALRVADQNHIANYLEANGGYSCNFGEDWPLSEKEISILSSKHASLVELLELTYLISGLYSSKVINMMQKDSVSSKPTSHEKNNALLDILRRRSLRDYRQTIKCLDESQQSHIAKVLSDGGVIVRAHVNLGVENVTEAENEIVTKMENLLNDRSIDQSSRILELLHHRVIAAKPSQSIVLYIYCKTIEELEQLYESLTSGKLKDSIELWFSRLLNRDDKIAVAALRVSTEEFEEQRRYFKVKTESEFRFRYLCMGMSYEDKNFKRFVSGNLLIGKGSFGEVYGPCDWNGKKCALKKRWFNNESMEDVEKELSACRQWMSLRHKSLLTIYDISSEPPAFYIMMEYASGGTLKKVLSKRSYDLPLTILKEWGIQIAEGMAYLHANNIVHGDLKSPNIVIMEAQASSNPCNKTLKITDFDQIREHDGTQSMTVIGTFAGFAPEVLIAGRFSKASDVWSYGVVLWEMLTRKVPYEGIGNQIIIAQALQGKLKLEIPDSCPDIINSILKKCLSSDKDKRPSFYGILELLSNISATMENENATDVRLKDKKKSKSLVDRFKGLFLGKRTLHHQEQKIASSESTRTFTDQMRHHREFLEEHLDPDFGLLDKLQEYGIIGWREKDGVTSSGSLCKKNSQLLDYILAKDQSDGVIEALKDADQIHIVNYLTANGENADGYGGEWPLTAKEMSTLDTNHGSLVDLLELTDLLDLLNSSKVINSRQMESISSKLTSHEKNRAFLDILRRRSLRDYQQTINCLHETKQKHIVDIMESGEVDSLISVNFTKRINVEENEVVFGVTKLGNEIYVLSQPRSSPSSPLHLGLIRVFEDRNPFDLQKEIEIKEIAYPNDIGSSETENCLYVCDSDQTCVWKITRETDDERKIVKWIVTDYQPLAMSVTRDGQLLMVNASASILMIYGSDAQTVRSIPFHKDIRPRHAVQTSNGNFIILYGLGENGEEEEEGESGSSVVEREWGIFELTKDGEKIVRYFNSSNETQNLSDPWYISLDSSDQVFVIDTRNERVILLYANLKWNRILCSTKEEEKETGIRHPWTLHYDDGKKQLFVGGEGVNILTLSR